MPGESVNATLVVVADVSTIAFIAPLCTLLFEFVAKGPPNSLCLKDAHRQQ